jgi:hypothetical protein
MAALFAYQISFISNNAKWEYLLDGLPLCPDHILVPIASISLLLKTYPPGRNHVPLTRRQNDEY